MASQFNTSDITSAQGQSALVLLGSLRQSVSALKAFLGDVPCSRQNAAFDYAVKEADVIIRLVQQLEPAISLSEMCRQKRVIGVE